MMKLKTTVIAVSLLVFLFAQRPAKAQVQQWLNDPAPTSGQPADEYGTTTTSVPQPLPAGVTLPVLDPETVEGYLGYEASEQAVSGGCTSCGVVSGCECGRTGMIGSLFGGRGAGRGSAVGGGGSPRPSRIWAHGEYLLWWGQERNIPALVTTSPNGTPRGAAGRLGSPTTSILFGDELIGDDAQSGFRVAGGFWLDALQTWGIGARYFLVGDEDDEFAAASDGDPILARPFFNTALNQPDALLVAFPGVSTGSVSMITTNKAEGIDGYLRKLLHAGYCNRLDFIGGYQYSKVEDDVVAANSLVSQDPGGFVPVGTTIDTRDVFEAENTFHGGFIGLMGVAEDGRLTWRMLSKVAFGNMRQRASISGSTVTTVPGEPPASSNSGLLATPNNIGTFERDEFAIVPELNLSVGYKLNNQVEMTVGYSFIHWSNVILAGGLVDPNSSTVQLLDDGFWYQGLSFGAHGRF